MRLFTLVLFACSGDPQVAEPSPDPVPARASVPKPTEIRAPLAPPPEAVAAKIDLATADPMRIVAEKGPGGTPAPAVSLLFASRGDGEIEPCG